MVNDERLSAAYKRHGIALLAQRAADANLIAAKTAAQRATDEVRAAAYTVGVILEELEAAALADAAARGVE